MEPLLGVPNKATLNGRQDRLYCTAVVTEKGNSQPIEVRVEPERCVQILPETRILAEQWWKSRPQDEYKVHTEFLPNFSALEGSQFVKH